MALYLHKTRTIRINRTILIGGRLYLLQCFIKSRYPYYKKRKNTSPNQTSILVVEDTVRNFMTILQSSCWLDLQPRRMPILQLLFQTNILTQLSEEYGYNIHTTSWHSILLAVEVKIWRFQQSKDIECLLDVKVKR